MKKFRTKLNKAKEKTGTTDPEKGQGDSSKETEIRNEAELVEAYMLQGLNQPQIGAILGISRKTVCRRVAMIRAQNLEAYNEVAKMKPTEKGAEIDSHYRGFIRKFMSIYMSTKQDHVKVQAIDGAVATTDRRVKLMQTLGLLPKDIETSDARPVYVLFKNMPRPDRSKRKV